MEIKIFNKKYESGTITFKTFLMGSEIMTKVNKGQFLANETETEIDEHIEAAKLIVAYFNDQFTYEDFTTGYKMKDGVEFMQLFQKVLFNIQMNNGERELEKDTEGK